MRLGPLQLQSPLLLAPIAGHCDLPFRLIVRRCGGVGMGFTDLLCPHGLLRNNPQTRWLVATCPDDRPLGFQLYGNEIDLMCRAAIWAVEHGAALIDINMGCPVDKVTKTFAGAMMLATADHTVALAGRLVDTVGPAIPVTAKLRLGYRLGELTAPDLARRLIDVGIAAITIHGRTAEQRFSGHVDLDGIAAVVHAVHETSGGSVPCIGNGDIRTPFDAVEMIQATGCDGVMIGRAALGAPWLFTDTQELLTTGRITGERTLRRRIEIIRDHAHLMFQYRGARFGLARLRQQISRYARHLGPCKSLRLALQDAASPAEIDDLLDRFLADAGPAADAVPVTWAARHEQLQIEHHRLQQQQVHH